MIAEIETDKATMEFQAYDAGTVLRIIVDDGETAALGAPIAIVGDAGETVEAPAEEAAEPDEAPRPETPVPDANVSAEPAPAPHGNGKTEVLRVSPIARRMADAAGLDLRTLAGQGSGPDGRIVKADVERALGGTASPQRMYLVQPFHRHRQKRHVKQRTRYCCFSAGRGRRGARALPHAEGGREADGRLQGDRPALLRHVRDRHDAGAGPAQGAERGARRLGREGVGERPHRAGLRAGARRCIRRRTARTSTAGTSTTPTPTSGSRSRSTTG